MNKKCVKICTPRALPSGDIIALAIDENFSSLLTLKQKFRTNKRHCIVWLSFNIFSLSPLG
jgi:hypothetical protein